MVIRLYIDLALINDFEQNYASTFMPMIEYLLNKCGLWYSAEGIRHETEDDSLTLEDICKEYYFIIDNDTIRFCNPDQLWEDIEEELK